LTWKWTSQSALFKQKSVLALLCLSIFLGACVALDAQPSKVANNSASANSSINNSSATESDANQKNQGPNTDHSFSWDKRDAEAKDRNFKRKQSQKTDLAALRKSFGVKNRMSLSSHPGGLPLHLADKKYSFKVEDSSIRIALREFATKYNLNMFVDQDIDGDITVDFKKLSLKKAMTLILGSHNYFWSWNDDLIRVSRLQTKVFVVDYLRLNRTGQSASTSAIANLSPQTAENERNKSSIQQNDNLAFWDELETQLSSLISDQGRFVINRISGTIQITDIPARVIEVDKFLGSLQQALHRQVEIDARIIEVSLSDDQALGIDWNAISIQGITGALSNTVTENQGLGLKSSTLALSYNHDNFTALISALEEQGSVKVVSQPRLRVLNNQPSLIKVGTDRTFFTQTVNRSTTITGGNDTLITEQPVTITEGLVLSLTPQISKDRWVMLDISPIITRVVDITTSPQGSTAPVLDVKQASTLIRAKDGEMIILGGLIQEEERKTDRQVPFFSAIPFVGKMFEGTNSTRVKKELIIFLVPRLVI